MSEHKVIIIRVRPGRFNGSHLRGPWTAKPVGD